MYGTGGIHVQFSWWKKSGGRDRFISHASFQFALPLPPDFPRQILQPPCFPMVCACRVAATKLLERKTGSSDIRSRDALIVLKVDSFIYCPTNHGKWRGFSLYLSISFSISNCSWKLMSRISTPVEIFSTIDRGCKRAESSNEGTDETRVNFILYRARRFFAFKEVQRRVS